VWKMYSALLFCV